MAGTNAYIWKLKAILSFGFWVVGYCLCIYHLLKVVNYRIIIFVCPTSGLGSGGGGAEIGSY